MIRAARNRESHRTSHCDDGTPRSRDSLTLASAGADGRGRSRRTDKESDCLVDNSFAARDIDDDDDDDANDANQLICAGARDGEGRGARGADWQITTSETLLGIGKIRVDRLRDSWSL